VPVWAQHTWLLYLAAAAASFARGDVELYHILFAHRGEIDPGEMDPADPVSASATTSRGAESGPPAGS
jgi:hypothetical protein